MSLTQDLLQRQHCNGEQHLYMSLSLSLISWLEINALHTDNHAAAYSEDEHSSRQSREMAPGMTASQRMPKVVRHTPYGIRRKACARAKRWNEGE